MDDFILNIFLCQDLNLFVPIEITYQQIFRYLFQVFLIIVIYYLKHTLNKTFGLSYMTFNIIFAYFMLNQNTLLCVLPFDENTTTLSSLPLVFLLTTPLVLGYLGYVVWRGFSGESQTPLVTNPSDAAEASSAITVPPPQEIGSATSIIAQLARPTVEEPASPFRVSAIAQQVLGYTPNIPEFTSLGQNLFWNDYHTTNLSNLTERLTYNMPFNIFHFLYYFGASVGMVTGFEYVDFLTAFDISWGDLCNAFGNDRLAPFLPYLTPEERAVLLRLFYVQLRWNRLCPPGSERYNDLTDFFHRMHLEPEELRIRSRTIVI